MILEERLISVFEQLPEVDGFKPVYHFGDDVEFNRFILKSTDSVYPLIWQLIKRESDDDIRKNIKTDLEFFIAVRNLNVDMFNTERWETSYKNVLVPVYENIKKAFIRSGIVRSDFVYEVFKKPNYSQIDNNDKNKTIDIIDAILVRLPNAEITKDCVRIIKFD
jgi:hypothetical protein